MCDFGASTYIALAAAAAAAGTGAVAANQSNKAQSAAVAAESARQQSMQRNQEAIISQQEAEKDEARRLFQSLVPEGGQERMQEREQEIGTALGDTYAAASAPTPGSDPTRDGDAVSTVGAPTRSGTGTPKAFDAAYAQQLARVLGFNTQQARARANMDALGISQNRANQAIQRGNEGIGVQGQIISGLGRNVQGIGALMDASNRNAQAQINSASHNGDNWKTASQVFGIISSLAGGGMDFGGNAYGQSKTAQGTAPQTMSTPTHNQRYYSTNTGARIN
jgi:hypothetical protein